MRISKRVRANTGARCARVCLQTEVRYQRDRVRDLGLHERRVERGAAGRGGGAVRGHVIFALRARALKNETGGSLVKVGF